MPADLSSIDTTEFFHGSTPLGIVIALIGGLFLALGAQFQHRGVMVVEERHGSGHKAGLSLGQIWRLVRSPWWVLGTILLGLAVLCQLTSLGFAPIIVVQPLGVVALVVTSVVNARASQTPLTRAAVKAIAFCVAGIAVFVTVAAFVAQDTVIREKQLIIILITMAVVVVLLGVAFARFRKRFGAIFYILAAGVLYGFVATLAKVVINRLLNGNFEWLTLVCVVALLAAVALGAYFVQTAYSVGSPDLVIAGLTVVDPIVAVSIGIVVLGEAAGAPLWTVFVWIVAVIVAVYGVFQLARTRAAQLAVAQAEAAKLGHA